MFYLTLAIPFTAGINTELWSGLIRESMDVDWGWIRNGRHPGADNAGDWGPTDPNGEEEKDLCARLMDGEDGFLAGDRTCSEKLSFLCEVWL